MDHLLIAAILGIVEGITEFLPISSTGHLIVAASLLDFHNERGKVFEIAIQIGAILAVVWAYRTRLWRVVRGIGREPAANTFAINLIVAFVPLAVLGLLLKSTVETYLFNPIGVAVASVVGAFVIFFVERKAYTPRIHSVDEMRPMDALKCGLAQAFALFPGMSRSGSSIVGGMLFGLSRQAATEFSFFLGIPTLTAAGLYSLYKNRTLFSSADIPLFLVGGGLSFVVALVVIRALIRYVATHTLIPFAWYRIAFGVCIVMAWKAGWLNWQ